MDILDEIALAIKDLEAARSFEANASADNIELAIEHTNVVQRKVDAMISIAKVRGVAVPKDLLLRRLVK